MSRHGFAGTPLRPNNNERWWTPTEKGWRAAGIVTADELAEAIKGLLAWINGDEFEAAEARALEVLERLESQR
jgi:hypothetical protein